MKLRNMLCFFLLVLAHIQVALSQHSEKIPETRRWIVNENSNLRVNGSTNINTFSCEIPAYNHTDTLVVSKLRNTNSIVLTGCVSLSVQSFDCKNAIMTHDLRKTLKAEQFPLLHIYFLTLDKLPDLTLHSESITGLVDIEIAGIKKRFDVNYQITQDAQRVIHLLGSRDVNFSDFHLIPPRKLGGMIQTKDKLSVDFHLRIRSAD